MDFCAGIGGGRLGLENNGLSAVAFSEIDKKAEITYQHFFGNKEKNWGDLMQIDAKKLSDFDVLIGGFPCQTFSILGKRKGFADQRGQIIYGLCKILKEKNPQAFILENLKGLVNHNNGRTLAAIITELSKLGYTIKHSILNSEDYGVSQMRERIYIIGTKNHRKDFNFPEKTQKNDICNFLIESDEKYLFSENNDAFRRYLNNKYNKGRFNINSLLQQDFLIVDTRQSDMRLYQNICPTLRTGRHGILYVKNGKFHRLSGFESLLLQWFSIDLAKKSKNLSDTNILSQSGNAMTVNVITATGRELLKCYE